MCYDRTYKPSEYKSANSLIENNLLNFQQVPGSFSWSKETNAENYVLYAMDALIFPEFVQVTCQRASTSNGKIKREPNLFKHYASPILSRGSNANNTFSVTQLRKAHHFRGNASIIIWNAKIIANTIGIGCYGISASSKGRFPTHPAPKSSPSEHWVGQLMSWLLLLISCV